MQAQGPTANTAAHKIVEAFKKEEDAIFAKMLEEHGSTTTKLMRMVWVSYEAIYMTNVLRAVPIKQMREQMVGEVLTTALGTMSALIAEMQEVPEKEIVTLINTSILGLMQARDKAQAELGEALESTLQLITPSGAPLQ